jgi:equilibrative nucleoside transporter 1/2/3
MCRYHLGREVKGAAAEPLLSEDAVVVNDTEHFNPVHENSLVNPLATNDATHDMSGHVSFSLIWAVYRSILVPALSVTATFTITIGLFPSLTVFLESTDKCKNSSRFSNDLFVPIMFLLFNLFDLIGRLTAGAFRPLFSPTKLWLPAVLRLVFFPLFLLCKISGSQLPTLFTNDFFPLFIMICFSFTNGYVASLCMMQGPTLTSPSNAALAGTIMVFSLTAGLLLGACTSFITVIISQGSV